MLTDTIIAKAFTNQIKSTYVYRKKLTLGLMMMSLTLLTGLSEVTTCCKPSMYPLFSSRTTVFTFSMLLTELGEEFPPLPMITFTLRPLIVRASVNVTSDSVMELF